MEYSVIIVTGATGKLGRRIVEGLLGRVPAEELGVSVLDPAKAQHFADRGVRVRHGSYTDPLSLAQAFQGADQVLLVSPPSLGEEARRQLRTGIEGAVAAGARRIVYTAHQGAGPASHFEACRDHAANEEALRACGAPFTSLRNGFYASSAIEFLGQAARTGELRLPEDGAVSWTTHDDLAEAAAAILADEGRFDGPTPALTGAHAITFEDVAALATEITGRNFKRITVSDEEFRDQLVGYGVPEWQAGMLISIFAASRAGEFATVEPTLASLIGREPIGFDVPLREALAAN